MLGHPDERRPHLNVRNLSTVELLNISKSIDDWLYVCLRSAIREHNELLDSQAVLGTLTLILI